MTSSQALSMIDYLNKQGSEFNDTDNHFIDYLKLMSALTQLNSQDEGRVRFIYEKKTRLIEERRWNSFNNGVG